MEHLTCSPSPKTFDASSGPPFVSAGVTQRSIFARDHFKTSSLARPGEHGQPASRYAWTTMNAGQPKPFLFNSTAISIRSPITLPLRSTPSRQPPITNHGHGENHR
ncbi:hypothetical protein AB0368_33540 [Actinoplanes sp. NPDC051475]|uniref:hypothetical protein n=1 Tax=Actinoplanes sp. NPDC051475 TaxID=3157225 RepID=UPI00344DE2FC